MLPLSVSAPLGGAFSLTPPTFRDRWYSADKRRKSRAYHRLVTGLNAAKARGEQVRFMTLTTVSSVALNDAFIALVKRIKRRFYTFEYCKIKTVEGVAGVIHLLWKGCYIPQAWLSQNWAEISGAYIVDVRKIWGPAGRIGNYLCNYLNAHEGSRLGYSWKWVYRGFAGDWRDLLRASRRTIGMSYCINFFNSFVQQTLNSVVPVT